MTDCAKMFHRCCEVYVQLPQTHFTGKTIIESYKLCFSCISVDSTVPFC